MARERVVYRCQTCGFASSKAGTCPDCARQGEYLALVEERPQAGRSARPALQPGARPQRLADIRLESGERVETGIGELDRGLGGGLGKGSLVAVGGGAGGGEAHP